ncbi:MAG: RNA polymerase sigma factor [Planctomycetota bacterium]|jgi:RNA polymerase sigma-70 factor (ECF subfamily)
MIDFLDQFILRYRRRPGGSTPTAAMALDRIGAVLLSLTNQEPPDAEPIRFADQDDIHRSQQGDSDAYRRLVERHQAHVGKLLWRFTRSAETHEELVQETFVQAYFSLATYKAQAPFEHWLTRIATRVGYRFWKQQSKHQHQDLMDHDWENLTSTEAADTSPQEAAELVHYLLAKLSPRDRLVLTTRYLEQCDVAETAARTGWTVSMVKVQTHRAKQKLKALAEKADIEIEI